MKINVLQIKCAAFSYLAFQLIKVVTSQLNNSGACPLISHTRSTRMDGHENSFGSPQKVLRLTKNFVEA